MDTNQKYADSRKIIKENGARRELYGWIVYALVCILISFQYGKPFYAGLILPVVRLFFLVNWKKQNDEVNRDAKK